MEEQVATKTEEELMTIDIKLINVPKKVILNAVKSLQEKMSEETQVKLNIKETDIVINFNDIPIQIFTLLTGMIYSCQVAIQSAAAKRGN